MHRIDGPAAAPGGFFTEGDPAVGTPATVVTDDWMNAVQGEIEAVVVAGGLSLAKPDNTQMLQAIRALVAAAMPAGAVQPFARATAPLGWLVCDGAAVSRSAYPVLWAAIGTTFGAGDGSTTFTLPDLRGEFIRGLDGGRGVDAGRVLGSAQLQALQLHGHPYFTAANNGNTDLQGGLATEFEGTKRVQPAYTGTPEQMADQSRLIGGFGGTETRPRNVALLYCIKT